VFNAITKQAVTDAMTHPRRSMAALVRCYMARRCAGDWSGFTLSPVFWLKLPGARSAEVQSGRAAAGLRPRASRSIIPFRGNSGRLWANLDDVRAGDAFEPGWSEADARISTARQSAPARSPNTSKGRSRRAIYRPHRGGKTRRFAIRRRRLPLDSAAGVRPQDGLFAPRIPFRSRQRPL